MGGFIGNLRNTPAVIITFIFCFLLLAITSSAQFPSQRRRYEVYPRPPQGGRPPNGLFTGQFGGGRPGFFPGPAPRPVPWTPMRGPVPTGRPTERRPRCSFQNYRWTCEGIP